VTFARWTFGMAGVLGLIVLMPLYFLEDFVGNRFPPPVTHPEYYYGFVGAAGAMQLVYLLIASNPRRYRPVMPIAVVAKLTFGIAALVLFMQGRLAQPTFLAAMGDNVFAVLFAVAYIRTRRASQ